MSSLFSIMSFPAAGREQHLSPDLLRKAVVETYILITPPIARSNTTNGSADFQNDAPCEAPDCTADTVPVVTMLQKDSTSDIVIRYRLLNMKHTNDKAVIWSAEWSANDHIYYVRDIGHHKIESITSNVSRTAHQLLSTEQIAHVDQ